MKDAPGGLRDLTAVRTIAALTDPALLRRGPRPIARGWTRPRTSCCASGRSCTSMRRRNDNVLSHELQETGARAARLSGGAAAAARRAADGRLLPARARRGARARARAPDRADARRANLGAHPRRDRVSSTRSARRSSRRRGSPSFQSAARRGDAGVADEALDVDPPARRSFAPPTTSSRRLPHRAALAARSCGPRPGLYARLSEMHDCGLLGRLFPEFQAIASPRGPRLLPQVHRRRAHAADHPQPRTAARCAATPPGAVRVARCVDLRVAGAAGPRAAATTTSGSGATTTTRSRACGMAQHMLDAPRPAAGAARDRRVPHPQPPADVAAWRSGATPRIRRSSGSWRRWSAPRSG